MSEESMRDSYNLAKMVYLSGNIDFPRDTYEKINNFCRNNDDEAFQEIYSDALLASVDFLIEDDQEIEARKVAELSLKLKQNLGHELGLDMIECKLVLVRCMQMQDACNMALCKTLVLEALEAARLQYGFVHAEVGDIYHSLAMICRNLKEWDMAVHYHYIAVHIFLVVYGPKNQVTMTAAGSIGITLDNQSESMVSLCYFACI